MPIFDRGTIVRVPYPHVEADVREVRPALVVDVLAVRPDLTLLWALMITSAENKGWPGDIPLLERHAECGLPVPSVIRTEKIATLDARLATALGTLPDDLWREVAALIAKRLASHSDRSR